MYVKTQAHTVFIVFLVLIGMFAVVSLSVRGWSYYLTPMDERPFNPEYSAMRPSGPYSHGLGMLGGLMIIVGVAMYMTRKRVRALSTAGRLSRWLEVHIFLCLLGPVLVAYHTTFKAGGVAAITLWTMLSVAASGIMGRFLYTQIPRNLNGTQLTMDEIEREMRALEDTLRSTAAGASLVAAMDGLFAGTSAPRTLMEFFSSTIRLQRLKSAAKRKIREIVSKSGIMPEAGAQLRQAASARAVLLQRSFLLSQVERVFFYWHAVHLPFTVIMFITLAAHVTVVALLGYRWLF